MGIWRNPACLIRTIYRSLTYGAYVLGHNYLEQPDGALICEVCGHRADVILCPICAAPINPDSDGECANCGYKAPTNDIGQCN